MFSAPRSPLRGASAAICLVLVSALLLAGADAATETFSYTIEFGATPDTSITAVPFNGVGGAALTMSVTPVTGVDPVFGGATLTGQALISTVNAACPGNNDVPCPMINTAGAPAMFELTVPGGFFFEDAITALTSWPVRCAPMEYGCVRSAEEERVAAGTLGDLIVADAQAALAKRGPGPVCLAEVYADEACTTLVDAEYLTTGVTEFAPNSNSVAPAVGCVRVYAGLFTEFWFAGGYFYGAIGDPHMYALDGSGAEFTPVGGAGSVYNLITSPQLQLNALWEAFVDHPEMPEATWNTALGAMCGGDRLQMLADIDAEQDFTVALNGERLAHVGEDDDAATYEGELCTFGVTHRAVTIVSPLYSIKLEASRSHGHALLNVMLAPVDRVLAARAHGIIGQTARAGYPLATRDGMAAMPPRERACARYIDGYFELGEAALDAYYSPADGSLFGTDFRFNLYEN